jgi:hypothetical protein
MCAHFVLRKQRDNILSSSLVKVLCNQNSVAQGRDLGNAIFGDSYQLINKTFMICQRKSYILIKGKLFVLSSLVMWLW